MFCAMFCRLTFGNWNSSPGILFTCHWPFSIYHSEVRRSWQPLHVPQARISPLPQYHKIICRGWGNISVSFLMGKRDSAFCLVTSDPRSKSYPLCPWCPFLLIASRHGRTHSDFTHKSFLGLRHREGDSPWWLICGRLST